MEGSGELSEELKTKLTEMHATAKKIHAGFLVKRPGVEEYATGTSEPMQECGRSVCSDEEW